MDIEKAKEFCDKFIVDMNIEIPEICQFSLKI